MRLLESVRAAAGGVAWFVKGVMGEDAYDKYAAHHAAAHASGDPRSSAAAPMTEREFWRDRTDRQDTNPEGRCC